MMAHALTAIRILAVDDHPVLREGIAALIARQPDMSLVAEAASAQEAIRQYRSVRPDVTLMDIQMPEGSGINAIIDIRSEFPAARIIVLTTYSGDVLANRALKAGACGYLLKGAVRKELVETIRQVHCGARRIDPDVAVALASHLNDGGLSVREAEVLTLVASGKSNKVIAGNLGLSEETIKGYLKNILVKLGASDRTHAVTLAQRRGIIGL
ncbi:MAG TPA: response regulator transcription factor [Steroidobacteraceae bacterium]|nr:response regulator transcription factor [Steroidobacteraceae bacterium]